MVTIVQKEDPVLRRHSEAVNPKDFNSPQLKKILENMKIALEKEEDGVAIAAPQIGVPLRIFIVSHRAFEFMASEEKRHGGVDAPIIADSLDNRPKFSNMVFINPVITKLSRKKVWVPEGCLSVRWLYGEVARSEKATVRAYDENGRAFTRGGSGLLAQIFQHETDHLNGVLFTDAARDVERVTREEQERHKNEQTN